MRLTADRMPTPVLPSVAGQVRWAVAALALLCSGCLFNNAPPPRYFAPPSALIVESDPPPARATAPRLMRLRRVQSAGYLAEQMVWRTSDVERGLYEQRRWTEFPSRYLERAMARALDRTPGIERVNSGRVAVLDLELVSFDEILAPAHAAEVSVVASLRDGEQRTLFERTFSVERPVDGDDAAATARAMGAALDAVVQDIATQVAAKLPAAH